eukprot:scaffold271289_cov29-Tisochrysis_lutea.AAC.1
MSWAALCGAMTSQGLALSKLSVRQHPQHSHCRCARGRHRIASLRGGCAQVTALIHVYTAAGNPICPGLDLEWPVKQKHFTDHTGQNFCFCVHNSW